MEPHDPHRALREGEEVNVETVEGVADDDEGGKGGGFYVIRVNFHVSPTNIFKCSKILRY